MKDILIFENQYDNVKDTFDMANLVYFNNELNFKVYPASQDFGDYNKIKDYYKIIVDLDLSARSEKDGYSVIEKIKSIPDNPPIIIMTGHSQIEEKLKEKDIQVYEILKKPIMVSDLVKYLK